MEFKQEPYRRRMRRLVRHLYSELLTKTDKMKNNFCEIPEHELNQMEIPTNAIGLLTSPFHLNKNGLFIMVPTETFKQFTDVVTAYVVEKNSLPNAEVSHRDRERQPDANQTHKQP